MRRRTILVALALTSLAGCSQDTLSPEAARGRQVYQAQCIACHNTDPAQPGPLGPPVRGASEELLRAKLVRGTSPPGYTPKRPTKLMQPMPHLAPDIPALTVYLR